METKWLNKGDDVFLLLFCNDGTAPNIGGCFDETLELLRVLIKTVAAIHISRKLHCCVMSPLMSSWVCFVTCRYVCFHFLLFISLACIHSGCLRAPKCVCLPTPSVCERLFQSPCLSEPVNSARPRIAPAHTSKRVQSSIITSTPRMELIQALRPTLGTTQKRGNVQGLPPAFLLKRCVFHAVLSSFYTQIISTHMNNVSPVISTDHVKILDKKKKALTTNQWRLFSAFFSWLLLCLFFMSVSIYRCRRHAHICIGQNQYVSFVFWLVWRGDTGNGLCAEQTQRLTAAEARETALSPSSRMEKMYVCVLCLGYNFLNSSYHRKKCCGFL